MEIPSELIEACRRGDAQAFESFVRLTQRQVYSLVYRIVGNHDDAADVTQEAYLKAWRGLRGFRGDAAVTSWLHRVASNAAIEHLRRRGRLAEPLEPEKMNAIEAPAPDEPAVDPADVEAALARIPPAYRAALVMREMYGMSMEEIAEQMKATTGATKVRLHRARLRLAAELERSGVVVPIKREKRSS